MCCMSLNRCLPTCTLNAFTSSSNWMKCKEKIRWRINYSYQRLKKKKKVLLFIFSRSILLNISTPNKLIVKSVGPCVWCVTQILKQEYQNHYTTKCCWWFALGSCRSPYLRCNIWKRLSDLNGHLKINACLYYMRQLFGRGCTWSWPATDRRSWLWLQVTRTFTQLPLCKHDSMFKGRLL